MCSLKGTSAPMSESLLLLCKSGFEVVALEPALVPSMDLAASLLHMVFLLSKDEYGD